jgi:hypothetical protein
VFNLRKPIKATIEKGKGIMKPKKNTVWLRLGVKVALDKDCDTYRSEASIARAIAKKIKARSYIHCGDSYVPDSCCAGTKWTNEIQIGV